MPHAAHRGVAGSDREVDPSRREAVQGRHRGDVHGRDPGAADRDAGPEAKAGGLPGGEGEHRVAVGEQHLAVRRPDRVVAEVLGVGVEADLVDVGHDAYSELHARPPRVRQRFYRFVWGGAAAGCGRGADGGAPADSPRPFHAAGSGFGLIAGSHTGETSRVR